MAAVTDHGVILARVNTPLVVGRKTVEEIVEGPDGEVYEDVRYQDITAHPGDIIDVAHWHAIGAYVERGQITLLGPADAELYRQQRAADEAAQARQAAEREAERAAKSEAKKNEQKGS